jgi:hypothetical protein
MSVSPEVSFFPQEFARHGKSRLCKNNRYMLCIIAGLEAFERDNGICVEIPAILLRM